MGHLQAMMISPENFVTVFLVFGLGFLRSLLCHCRVGKMLLSQQRSIKLHWKNLTDKVDQWLPLKSLSLISIRQILVIFCPPHILRDPGADIYNGGEGKSKRAEKYIWNEEK